MKVCMLGHSYLPTSPCFVKECPWYTNNLSFCNCFFLLNDFMYRMGKFDGFSVEEISKFEGLEVKEVEEIILLSLKKIRLKNRKTLVELYDLNYES